MQAPKSFEKSIFCMVIIRPMNLSGFDLNLLKVLDALLHEGSTVRAGQRVGLSQPAVSAALGRLRAAFEDPLLIRAGQSLRPTEFALTLVTPVRNVLEDAGALLARPAFDPSAATDTFRLAGSDFFTEMLLPDLMARLQRDAPRMTLRYTDAVGMSATEDLREGRLDLVLLPVTALQSWLESEVLFHADYCVIARRDHPDLTAKGIRPGQPIPTEIFFRLRHAVFRVFDERPEVQERLIASTGHHRAVAMRASSFTAVWQVVAATDLIGMIPVRLARKVADHARLDVFETPFELPRAEICQAWHRRNSSSRGLIWLRIQLAEILADLDDRSRGN
jgi:DNA-binding transcriptional LysR family regulator